MKKSSGQVNGGIIDKWKEFYTLHEMNLFSELHFVWCSIQVQNGNESAQSADSEKKFN